MCLLIYLQKVAIFVCKWARDVYMDEHTITNSQLTTRVSFIYCLSLFPFFSASQMNNVQLERHAGTEEVTITNGTGNKAAQVIKLLEEFLQSKLNAVNCTLISEDNDRNNYMKSSNHYFLPYVFSVVFLSARKHKYY